MNDKFVDLSTAAVGIFWVIQRPGNTAILLDHRCMLNVAEPYGEMLTCPHGHYDLWGQWRTGKGDISSAIRAVIATSEYEEWPRGRIVFDTIRQEFTCYADVQILRRADLLAAVRDRFGLPKDRTRAMWDSHYRSTIRIKE